MATLINVSVLEADDQGGLYIPTPGVWEDYWIRNSYFTDGHRYMMGISSPGGFNGSSAAFVQLAAPTLLWQCEWTAEKQGASPTLPSPTDLKDGGWVLLDQQIEPEMIELAPDGASYIYRINGIYWYGHTNPNVAQIVHPIAAWFNDQNGPGVRTVAPNQFVTGLIDTYQGNPSTLPPSAGDLS